MSVSIRAAVLGDAEVLAELCGHVQRLHSENRPDRFKPADLGVIAQWFKELLESPVARAWIAEEEGVALGYVTAVAHDRPEGPFSFAWRWWQLDQIGVRPASRRSGVARALAERVMAEARAQGVAEVELTCWAFNEDGQRAFARLGFKPMVTRFELLIAD